MGKKDFPLTVLQELAFLNENESDSFSKIDCADFLLSYIDVDPDSTFYFKIKTIEVGSNIGLYKIHYAPADAYKLNYAIKNVYVDELKITFANWIALIEGYDVKSVFDDPIIESYKQEFTSQFEIVNEDNIHPFPINQILLIEQHLEEVSAGLEDFKTETNKDTISGIQEDIKSLQDQLTQKPQKWVVGKLTTIWAKITKQGPKLFKALLSEAIKEVVKHAATAGYDRLIN